MGAGHLVEGDHHGTLRAQDVTSASNDVEHSCSSARERRSRFRNALNLSASNFLPRLIIHVNRSLYLDRFDQRITHRVISSFDGIVCFLRCRNKFQYQLTLPPIPSLNFHIFVFAISIYLNLRFLLLSRYPRNCNYWHRWRYLLGKNVIV